MKITHYCNSFISVNEGGSKIVCDPWLGKADNNAWLSYPLHSNGARTLNSINPEFIYISHLHNDHFDPKILKRFKNKKQVKILIKKFKFSRLKSKIFDLGFNKIIELEPWKKIRINKFFTITIIPQQSNNKDDIETEIVYDLDTSILIQSNITKKLFYNNVDNPLSVKDVAKLNRFIKKEYKKKLDVTCFPIGGASEYPQCFVNVKKNIEKDKVISRSVASTYNKLKILKPEVFFPAGGNYMIYGKFCKVNKYIAQPNNYLKIFSKFNKININSFNLEGGGYIYPSNLSWVAKNLKKTSKHKLVKEIEKIYMNDKYDYEYTKTKSNKLLDSMFKKSLNKYLNLMETKFKGIKWIINFYLYNNLKLQPNAKISSVSKPIKKYTIQPKTFSRKVPILDCHLDRKLFYCLLSRKYNWNIALSGSLIHFKRKPNKFIPDIPFSLNFLTN